MTKAIKSLACLGVLIPLILAAAGSAYALNPMRIQIRTALPESINTVGQAAQYFADAIGYNLVTAHPAPAESRSIANELLNPLSNTNNTQPVEEAILSLLREEYVLVVDHDHKLFSFEKRGGQQ